MKFKYKHSIVIFILVGLIFTACSSGKPRRGNCGCGSFTVNNSQNMNTQN